MTEDALVTIARPKTTSATTVNSRIQSVFNLCAMLQVPYQFFEDSAAMLVGLKLIKACAGGCEQDDVSGACFGCGSLDGCVDGAGVEEWQSGEVVGNFGCGSADEQNSFCFRLKFVAKDSVVAALVFAAENDPEVSGEGVDGFFGGVYVGCFGVVVIANSVPFTDELDAVFDTG